MKCWILVTEDSARRIAYRLIEHGQWFSVMKHLLNNRRYVTMNIEDHALLHGTAAGEAIFEFGEWEKC